MIPPEHKLPCIYCITSKITHKSYIGQTSKGFHFRKLSHLNEAKRNERQSLLYQAIREQGEENFEWEILYTINNPSLTHEEVLDRLNQKEKEFVKKYNSVKGGYNIRRGGGNKPREKYSYLTQQEKEQLQIEKYKKNKQERHKNDEERKQRVKERRLKQKDAINARKRERHKYDDNRRARRRSYRAEYLRKYRILHKEELYKKQRERIAKRKEVMPNEVYDNRS